MLNLKTHCLLIFILPFDPVIQIHMAACLYLQVFTSKSLQENQQPLCSLHGICKTSFYFNLILKARYHLQPWGFGTLQSAAFKLFQGLIWHSCRILVCVCVFLYIDIHGFFFLPYSSCISNSGLYTQKKYRGLNKLTDQANK